MLASDWSKHEYNQIENQRLKVFSALYQHKREPSVQSVSLEAYVSLTKFSFVHLYVGGIYRNGRRLQSDAKHSEWHRALYWSNRSYFLVGFEIYNDFFL